MIFRIQTPYLFLIFALGTTLFIENPIVNEIHFHDGNQTQMEYTEYWCYAKIGTDTPIPLREIDILNCVLLIMISISSFIAIFFIRRPKIQFGLCSMSLFSSVFLLSRLLIRFRIRVNQLNHSLVDSIETPYLLWFGLLFALQILVFRFLWRDLKRVRWA